MQSIPSSAFYYLTCTASGELRFVACTLATKSARFKKSHNKKLMTHNLLLTCIANKRQYFGHCIVFACEFSMRVVCFTRFLILAVLAVWAMLISSATHARTALDLRTQVQPVALEDRGDYWIDTTGALTAAQISANPHIAWQPTNRTTIYPVTSGNVLWMRFTVPPAPDSERWLVELPNPAMDRVSLYAPDGAGNWVEKSAGDSIAVRKWPVPHRHPVLPIDMSAKVTTNYLMRLENAYPVSAAVQFVGEGHLSRAEQRISMIFGVFFGLTGLAVAVSLLSAISLRDPAFGLFGVVMALMAVTQAAFTGLGGLYLWPDWSWWNQLSTPILTLLTSAATSLFISTAVALQERSPRLHRLLVSQAMLFTVLAVIYTLGLIPAPLHMQTLVYVLIWVDIICVAMMLWSWRLGDRLAPWLLFGYVPILVSVGWMMANYARLIPIDFFTQHGLQFGVALHLPIVMVVLMLRSQHRRENYRRIQGLDKLDPATGLINARIFTERLSRMATRSQRLKQSSALLMIDIVNADQIQRDFGRKAAEDLPLRVAERLLSIARDIDSPARLSHLRFGILIEGPLGEADAAALGQRIVARCLMSYREMHVDCVAQVKVAYALLPYQDASAQRLISALEDILTAAPAKGRAVFVLGKAQAIDRPHFA